METSHELAQMFKEDVRHKNHIVASTCYRKSSRPMRTPVDGLKYGAKKIYQGNGKVEVYNMYEQTIVGFSQFQGFSTDRQKELLEIYREKFSAKEIQKAWKISTVKYYSILKKLEIDTRRYSGKGRGKGFKNATKQITMDEAVSSINQVAPTVEPVVEPTNQLPLATPVVVKQEPEKELLISKLGLQIKIDGTYEGRIFGEKLNKLLALMENDSSKYEIKLEIVETA